MNRGTSGESIFHNHTCRRPCPRSVRPGEVGVHLGHGQPAPGQQALDAVAVLRPLRLHLQQVLAELRTWDGRPVPAELQQRLLREQARWAFVARQIKDLENERARRIRTATEEPIAKVRQLLKLQGIGANSAWLYVMEGCDLFSARGMRSICVTADAGHSPTSATVDL